MLNRFKIITCSIIFSIFVIGIIIYFTSSRPKLEWTIMAGDRNGKYHEVAKALSEILLEQEGFKVKIRTSSGSVENLYDISATVLAIEGNYTATLTVSADNGLMSTDIVNIDLNHRPTAEIISVI